MASDVQLATKYAVANNNPQSFKNISEEPALAEENFSSRNVNPEYISRYQATEAATTSEDGVIYFDESSDYQGSTGNINAYDNYTTSSNGSNSGFSNVNFNFGLGFGYSPYGWGMSPYMGINYGWGFMPGLSIGLGFGFGYPMYPSYGWGYPMYPGYGWGYPMYGYGYPMYGYGYPVYPGYPAYVLPGSEYGNRRVVYGARPTRGSSITNTGVRGSQAAVMPSTARAQARNSASASNPAARRLVSSGGTSRTATRDFGSSQNDYYNASRSRVATSRNISSPAADRAVSTRSRSSIPSARSSFNTPASSSMRNYSSPARTSNPSYNSRTSSPSYNRGSIPSYNNRSTSPSYNTRSTSPSYNRSSSPSYNRTVTPSRSNNTSTFSSPSRSSSGGSMSAPSRSSGGSSGGSVGGSRGGRGN
ncbi:hypothetical protein J0A68_14580 [Algoriphagus sp. H41]|uniref:Prolyl-tRNA synthetase n=1 Tax=Algoriphagus oliviformis TaxID=2811231 RepID=A0ABS3C7P5_9BACT|nr:hypothetical protein [Algoriphagus oliviformis]MBN7812176.1 hypothetical protein [Algoriphagus oliviformis]